MTYRVSRFMLHLLMCYISIIVMLGYGFGDSDMVESLSVLLHMNNPELLTQDFYVSSLQSVPLNERIVFIYLMQLGSDFLTTWAVILHAIFGMTLIAGLYKITSLYLASRFFRWITIYITIVVLSNYNLGGNELYYNYLVPSLPSKAFAAWAIYFFLTDRIIRSSIFLILGALFQPIVAVQILVLAVVSSIPAYWKKQVSFKKTDLISLVFIIPFVLYLVALWRYHHAVPMDAQEYIDILRLRMPHHFFPSYYPLSSYIIYLILAGFAGYWYFHNGIRIFYWIIVTILGCLVYYGLLAMGFDIGLNTQWFKTTIWLEFFGVLSIMGFINERVMMRLNMAYFFAILLSTLTLFLVFRWPPLTDKEYDYGDRWLNDPEIVIAQAAKELTDPDALFIIPPQFDMFRQVAERSVFIDFKSIAHNKKYLREWTRRMEQVYKLKTGANQPAGFTALVIGTEQYYSLEKSEIDQLVRDHKITHMLTHTEHFLPYPVVVRTTKYVIYNLSEETS